MMEPSAERVKDEIHPLFHNDPETRKPTHKTAPVLLKDKRGHSLVSIERILAFLRQPPIQRSHADIHALLVQESVYKIRCKGHVVGTNPLFVFVTTINKENFSSLVEGLNETRKYARVSRRARPPILIIHIAGYSIVAQEEREKVASEIIELEERSMLGNLSRLGAHTVHWDPTVNSFSDMLLSQVKRR